MIIDDIQFKKLLTAEEVQQIVQRMAAEVYQDYKDKSPLFVGVLNGAFRLTSDFISYYEGDCKVSFVKLASYSGLTSTQLVQTLLEVSEDIEGHDIVILEDIIDSGRTLKTLVDMFSNAKVNSFRIASLLYKKDTYQGEYAIDYIGREIPSEFVVGYGLDYNEEGRNLNAIYIIDKDE
jgi:adenylate kinase